MARHRQAPWLPGSHKRSRTLSSSSLEVTSCPGNRKLGTELRRKSQSDKSQGFLPLFVPVFIHNLLTQLIIYLHIDLWQVSEIFITGMFFFCLSVILQDRNQDVFFFCGEDFSDHRHIHHCSRPILFSSRKENQWNQKQNVLIAKVFTGLVRRFKTCLTH